jgi:hypothetical protein
MTSSVFTPMLPVDPKSAMRRGFTRDKMGKRAPVQIGAVKSEHSYTTFSFLTDVPRIIYAAFLFMVSALCAGLWPRNAGAQAVRDTTKHTTLDTAYQSKPALPVPGIWRKPSPEYQATAIVATREALRYARSPLSLSALFEDMGTVFPLVLGEESYGRESWLSTGRTSEAPVAMDLDGFVPIVSALNGAPLTNFFPLHQYSKIGFERGAAGIPTSGAQNSGSDAATFTIERFRAPVPYSRIYYVQDLTRSISDFDALFSVNASKAVNTAFGLFRRASGRRPDQFDPTFNPRTDVWSIRGQATLASGDSNRERSIDGLLWGQYTTAFSGLAGGIMRPDSGDVFDLQTASAVDVVSFDHRIRGDAIFDLSLPFLAESPTFLGAYYTYESRRFVTRDTLFPPWVRDVSVGTRYGAVLAQPLNLSFGDFLTRAELRGDLMHFDRDSLYPNVGLLTDTRLAASFSDSLALRTQFRISLFGFFKLTSSNVKIANGAVLSSVFPSWGATGTIGFTDAVSFTASYFDARDRAELSPDPLTQYQLRNLSAFLDLHVGLGHDSLAIHAGVLDRHEPEGIVPLVGSDTLNPVPIYSGDDVHSQSAQLAIDLFTGHFHFAAGGLYVPTVTLALAHPYTTNPSLQQDLLQRFYGNAGVYYENELQEGNLRLSAGARMRFIDRLEPQLTYDRASDYYWYRGLGARGVYADPSTWTPISDPRVANPKGVLDLLITSEIDRRAQISMSFLNILGTPFYTTSVYPYSGFHWRLSVTWAFLD